MNEEHFRRYAELLVKVGVNPRPGQPLYVYGQVAHRRLIALLTEVAYEAGSGAVETRSFDALQKAALIRHGRIEDIELCHSDDQAWFHQIVRHGGAYICLVGRELPRLWDQLAASHPDRYAAYLRGLSAATGGIYRYGLELRCYPWLTAACPTEGWARGVFPELPARHAFDRLAKLIFRFTGADQENACELAEAKNRLLQSRCRKLDELAVREIRVRGGGNDFRLVLTREARWQGGSQTTASGQTFCFNLPSEEVFTTPDQRETAGRLAATRPFRASGSPPIRDLVLDFREGRVVHFDASSGKAAFARLIETDDGARRLGEFALIGEDSSIARSGLFFDEIIFDENASCHVALGQAFVQAGAGGESMGPRQLGALGVNSSRVHTDLMFGSPEVTIVATESREGEVVLIDRGRWAPRFLEQP